MNSLKKLLLLSGIVIMILSSCEKKNDVTVGFLIPATEGSRWVIDKKYVEDAALSRNVELIIRSAENDENLQLRQAEELLELGVDVLVTVPVNANTAAAIVRDAHEKSVPVVAYDRLIKNCDLDYLVSFKGENIGQLMIEHAIERVPKGNYVILWGDANDVNAIAIKKTQEAMLDAHVKNGSINIVYKSFVENWSVVNAYQTMKKVIDFSDEPIDAVITSYDGLALGALQAIEEAGVETVQVLTGQDAEIGAIKSIVEGKMTLSVYKSIKETANAAINLSISLAKGEKVENATSTIFNGRKDVPMILLKPVPVTSNTIRSTVLADGFYTEEEVYGN